MSKTTQTAMFDIPPVVTQNAPVDMYMEYPQRLRWRIRTDGVDPEGRTCKGCVHLHDDEHHNVRYWKCDLNGSTRGAGSDWKLKWPACGRRIDTVAGRVIKLHVD